MTSKSAFEISSDQKVHLVSAANKIGKFSWPACPMTAYILFLVGLGSKLWSVTLKLCQRAMLSVVRTAAFSTGNYHFLRFKSAFYLVYLSRIPLKEEQDYPPQKSRTH